MEISQLETVSKCKGNLSDLQMPTSRQSLDDKNKSFKNLFIKTKEYNPIQSFLLYDDRASELFTRSNKSIRKLENMIDVINFSLFDFEQNYKNNQEYKVSHLLQDIISILNRTKKTISQETTKNIIDLKACEDVYLMAIYAAIQAINQILNTMGIISKKTLDELNNMRISLIFAVDEQLGQ